MLSYVVRFCELLGQFCQGKKEDSSNWNIPISGPPFKQQTVHDTA